MLSIAAITAAQRDYYVKQAIFDYYRMTQQQGLQVTLPASLPTELTMGLWLGGGKRCHAAWPSGRVTPAAFDRIIAGFHPTTGAPLVKNAGHPDRQIGWDFCVSAPKWFSVLVAMYLLLGRDPLNCSPPTWWPPIRCFATLKNTPMHGAGAGGKELVKVGLVAIAILHIENRDHGPQVHLHCIVNNVEWTLTARRRRLLVNPSTCKS